MTLRTSIVFALCALALTACGRTGTVSWNNGNPLIASRYGDELSDTMASLIIADDPVSGNKDLRPVIDRTIVEGKKIATHARTIMARGMQGGIIPIKENLGGYALYVDNRLYLSSDFETKPGPDLHVYLTQAVDPRDAEFPDPTAVDLGSLQSPYGAQEYAVPHQKKADALRTLVLWDASLKRLYGFAQLSKRQ